MCGVQVIAKLRIAGRILTIDPSKACCANHSNELMSAESSRAEALRLSMVSFPWRRGLFLEAIVRIFPVFCGSAIARPNHTSRILFKIGTPGKPDYRQQKTDAFERIFWYTIFTGYCEAQRLVVYSDHTGFGRTYCQNIARNFTFHNYPTLSLQREGHTCLTAISISPLT